MKNYRFDFSTKTLYITKDFADKANNPISKEYELLLKFQKDFPQMKVENRTHKTPTRYRNSNGAITSRNQFKGLSYDRMEHFINALPRSEEYVREYLFVKDIGGYATAAKWFMEQFPNYRNNPLVYLYDEVDVVPAASVIEAA